MANFKSTKAKDVQASTKVPNITKNTPTQDELFIHTPAESQMRLKKVKESFGPKKGKSK